MEFTEAYDILKEAIMVTIKVGAPMLIAALALGLLVSIFQAMTQIQEATLSFIPKLLGILTVLILFLPRINGYLSGFAMRLMDRI